MTPNAVASAIYLYKSIIQNKMFKKSEKVCTILAKIDIIAMITHG